MKFFGLLFALLLPLMSLQAAPVKVPRDQFYRGAPNLRSHPGHYPYISFLTFRNMCDWIIDQSTDSFDPAQVKQGDIIYINIWFLPWFEKNVHDHIKHPYILVSGDVGAWVPNPNVIKKLLLDPKLAAWFCRNMIFSHHPRLRQIPMGQDLALFKLEPEVVNELINAEAKKPLPKQHFLYMCHYPRAHGDRDKIVKLFENEPYCFSRNHSNKPWHETGRSVFYEDILSSQFVLSPLGLETDCVRTWEAFVLDCIPIVEHTFCDPIYEGMPIVKVHDWTEINKPFLEAKYKEQKGKSCEKAYFDYWYKEIKDFQTKVRNKDLDFTYPEATQFSDQDLQDLIFVFKKNKIQGGSLIYRGALTAVRPLQLANEAPFLSRLYVYDPWINQESFNLMGYYLSDYTLLMSRDEISMLSSENHFMDIVRSNQGSPVFLDFTHYRHSLYFNDFNNCFFRRHALKNDLHNLYSKLSNGTLLCGNMANDEYVQKVLNLFSREKDLKIETRGNVWFFLKK